MLKRKPAGSLEPWSRQDWIFVIDLYMTNNKVRIVSDVVVCDPSTDKAAPCVMAQLLAEANGLC